MSLFAYQPLTPGRRSMRLIRVLPRSSHPAIPVSSNTSGRTDIRVFCTVSHVSLDQPPAYKALSYTWGDASQLRCIILNGATFQVTENLEIALAHLTLEDEPVAMWIDALCINQNDEVEKSDQVQHMQLIYAHATLVLAWLGPSADNSDIAMRWMQLYGNKSCDLRIGETPDLRLVRLLQQQESDPGAILDQELRAFVQDVRTCLSPTNDGHDGNVSNALTKMLERPYWSRVWIVQELVHGKSLQFICGDEVISDEQLHQSVRLVRGFAQYQDLRAAKRLELNTLELQRSAIDTRNPISILKLRRATGPFPLIYLIRTMGMFRATDSRDRIFALLSFAADATDLGLRADYQKPWKEIYVNATVSLLKSGCIDILSLCNFSKQWKGLPSWVPNLTRSRAALQQRAMIRNATPIQTVLQPNFNACGSMVQSHVSAHLSGDSAFVSLSSKLVDIVTSVGSAWEPKGFQPWLKCLRDLSVVDGDKPDANQMKRVWRVAVADQEIRQGTQKPRLSGRELDAVHAVLKEVDLDKADAQTFASLGLGNYFYQLHDTAVERRPYRTSKGYFGIGPSDLQPGDFLHVIAGATAPYILRRDDKGRLLLVGEAYAYGLMDGEVETLEGTVDIIDIY